MYLFSSSDRIVGFPVTVVIGQSDNFILLLTEKISKCDVTRGRDSNIKRTGMLVVLVSLRIFSFNRSTVGVFAFLSRENVTGHNVLF